MSNAVERTAEVIEYYFTDGEAGTGWGDDGRARGIAQALANAGLIATEKRDREVAVRAWGEGYEHACDGHRVYDSCGQPNAHSHHNANPYRATSDKS